MKKFLSKIALSSVVLLAACGSQMSDDVEDTSMTDESAVVATVNGAAITQAQVDERVAMIASAQGQAPSVEVAINQLVDEELVFQSAEEKGITVSQADVDAEFEKILQNAGGQEALQGQLTALNLTEEKLRTDLRVQLLIQKYLESEVDINGVEVSDSEVQTAYDDAAATQDVPPLDDNIRNQISEQLLMQKKNELAIAHVAALREAADIQIGPAKEMPEEAEEMVEEMEEEEGMVEEMEDATEE